MLENESRLSTRLRSPAREWPYLARNHFWLLASLVLLCAVALFYYYNRGETFHDSNLLVVCIMAIVGCSYAVTRVNYAYAEITLIAGCLILVLFGAPRLPGSNLLIMLPVLLSTILASKPARIAIAVGTLLIVLAPAGRAYLMLDADSAAVLSLLVMTVLAVGLLLDDRQNTLLVSLMQDYDSALIDLERARDQRQLLNETNRTLEDAFIQLQRITNLYHAAATEAENARRTKETFAANVSHELRTPLNMIIGFSDMILNSPSTYGVLTPTLASDMNVIYRNSQHLLNLINDVLDLSQIEAGQLALRPEYVNVDELIEEAVSAIQPLYRSKSLTLQIELESKGMVVYCDRLRVRQILLNLLSNAGKHTSVGGAMVVVREDGKDSLLFSVRDTGSGIAGEDLEAIFERFNQGVHAADAATSTGLGLSISKQLIEAHSGRMWVESEPGSGANFLFTLPLEPVRLLNTTSQRWVHEYMQPEQTAGKRRLPNMNTINPPLFLVTREEEVQRQIRDFFANANAGTGTEPNANLSVVVIENLDDVQQRALAEQPVALLLNEARAMNDLNFARARLENLPSRMPVISFHLSSDSHAFDEYGVVDYLTKPISRERLLRTIEENLPKGQSGGVILLIEDNIELGRLLRKQIMSAGRGYRLLTATTGAEAVVLMNRRAPDLILMDLGLPDMDGFDLLAIKSTNERIRAIPVVIVSARDRHTGQVVADRIRVSMKDGLSLRDIARCTQALSCALGPAKP